MMSPDRIAMMEKRMSDLAEIARRASQGEIRAIIAIPTEMQADIARIDAGS